MNPERLRELLADVAEGRETVEGALGRLSWTPVEDAGIARIDHHRSLRQGYPEVIFGAGKTPEQVLAIAERIAAQEMGFLATRLSGEAGALLFQAFTSAEYNRLARAVHLPPAEPA